MSELEKKFASALRRARGEKSQAEFANFLQIPSQQSYSRYERGQIPDGEVLLTIASKLGVSIEELLTGKKAVSSQSHVVLPEKPLTDQEIPFFMFFPDRMLYGLIEALTAGMKAQSEQNQRVMRRGIQFILRELERRERLSTAKK